MNGQTQTPNVVIVGRPNVGKSSLINAILSDRRTIVSHLPGTTRDAVDIAYRRGAEEFVLIDTAGIRPRGKHSTSVEVFSVMRSERTIRRAALCVLVIDATMGVTAQDKKIAALMQKAHKPSILVVNKWDLVISGKQKPARPTKANRMREGKRPGDRDAYEQRLRYELKFLNYAPIVFISAQSGKGTEKIFPLLETVATERRKRVSTSQMNRFIEKVDFERASVPLKSRVKILYMTQAAVAPPVFVLFTNRAVKLHFSYQRFLENQIRQAFGFIGTPIWIKNRARDSQ